jgi:hypothetical protein
MKAEVAVALALGALATMPARIDAHHSFAAEFDITKPVKLTGVVSRIEWTNPHSHLFVVVTDDAGQSTTWKFELASPKVLAQLGWRPTLIHIGDEVTVEGAMAKDGSWSGNAREVTFANGQRVSAGSSGGDIAPPR